MKVAAYRIYNYDCVPIVLVWIVLVANANYSLHVLEKVLY